MRQFFLSIPVELEEAAALDGCKQTADLPPGRAAAGQTGARHPGDLHPAQRLERPGLAADRDQHDHIFTVQLGIANFQSTRRTQWGAADGRQRGRHRPADLFFLFAQKHFIATMTMSGLKG